MQAAEAEEGAAGVEAGEVQARIFLNFPYTLTYGNFIHTAGF